MSWEIRKQLREDEVKAVGLAETHLNNFKQGDANLQLKDAQVI